MKTSAIRQAFIDYFTKHGHTYVPSSSLVPTNDATLLFTNAGMVQFKDIFLGNTPRPFPCAVSAQRCVRAGGKHNDLDNVGYTARHHTFFEMLGNFSFGDYFKREAIRLAWTFLTEVLQLPKERLWVTVHERDDETAALWLNDMGISPLRFSRCGDADNFWSMGETGPCGPCTEIFYDHGPEIEGGPPGHPGADGDRYIEIWNLVFMQYNRDKDGTLHPLPLPSVDTGMGLERIAAVVQGVHNNYEIDTFARLITQIASLTPGVSPDHPSLKVIADHLRACVFLIFDGVLPSNEGRGYVLRRIIRRAVRHGHHLGLPLFFFSQLVPALVVEMGEAYPELIEKQHDVAAVLAKEEQQFAGTLEQGLKLLQEQVACLTAPLIPGDIAFKLYDTYGFPLDLTEDIAREQGISVDVEGFERCMQQQRLQSQAASSFHQDDAVVSALMTLTSEFEGYTHTSLEAQVQALVVDGERVTQLMPGVSALVVLDRTPFYAESGGQAGDQGQLLAQGMVFRVEDTQTMGNVTVHHGVVLEGVLVLEARVLAQVDVVRRDAIRLNHTATHLVHAALKTLLGQHVQQRGSLVEAALARFDFSHNKAMSVSELEALERLVNQHIRDNVLVDTAVMSLDDARQQGACALFEDKYGTHVRVLSMGEVSKELCGGTHAGRTGDLGLFKITAEYGVASGVRRLEWVTGSSAILAMQTQSQTLNTLAELLKTSPQDVVKKANQTLADMKGQEKELLELKQSLAVSSGQALQNEVQKIGDVSLLVKRLDQLDAAGLRLLLDQLRSSLTQAVIVLCSVQDNKLSVVAAVSTSLLPKVPSAVQWVRHLCGKGGGRDDMAQGGGPLPDDFSKRLASITTLLTP